MLESPGDWGWLGLLALVGIAAGFVNTLAGGGSLLTLPVLMLAGLPPHVANASNRVGVLLQCIAGTAFFDRAGRLDRSMALSVSAPILLGAVGGAATAAYLPGDVLKPVLLGAMVAIACLMLLRPAVLVPQPGEAVRTLVETPVAYPTLLVVGFYGGFAQAGVGILLLAAFGGLLRMDLVRSNAMKLLVNTGLTAIALLIFLVAGQVHWRPGLALALGMVLGARLAVTFAIQTGHENLRRFVLVVAIAACIAAWFA